MAWLALRAKHTSSALLVGATEGRYDAESQVRQYEACSDHLRRSLETIDLELHDQATLRSVILLAAFHPLARLGSPRASGATSKHPPSPLADSLVRAANLLASAYIAPLDRSMLRLLQLTTTIPEADQIPVPPQDTQYEKAAFSASATDANPWRWISAVFLDTRIELAKLRLDILRRFPRGASISDHKERDAFVQSRAAGLRSTLEEIEKTRVEVRERLGQ